MQIKLMLLLLLLLIYHNILFILIFHKTKKHKLKAQHGALKLSLKNCISFAHVILPQWLLIG